MNRWIISNKVVISAAMLLGTCSWLPQSSEAGPSLSSNLSAPCGNHVYLNSLRHHLSKPDYLGTWLSDRVNSLVPVSLDLNQYQVQVNLANRDEKRPITVSVFLQDHQGTRVSKVVTIPKGATTGVLLDAKRLNARFNMNEIAHVGLTGVYDEIKNLTPKQTALLCRRVGFSNPANQD